MTMIWITFSICFLIRYFFVTKHESYVAKETFDISKNEYFELKTKLEKLSQKEIDDLIISFDEWVKNKKLNVK